MTNTMLSIYCEICGEKIATADMHTLRHPLKGSQFLTPDSWHGYPPPFDPGATWEEMRCPYCRRRPFLSATAVMTGDGIYEVPRPEDKKEVTRESEAQDGEKGGQKEGGQRAEGGKKEKITCSVCGKAFVSKGALLGHMRWQHRSSGSKTAGRGR